MIGAVLASAPERPAHGDTTDATPDAVSLLPFAAMLAALVAPPPEPPSAVTPSASMPPASTPPASVPPEPQREVTAPAQAQAQAVLVAPVPPSRNGRDQNEEAPPIAVVPEPVAPPGVAAPEAAASAERNPAAPARDQVGARTDPLPAPRSASAASPPRPSLEPVVPREPAPATAPTVTPAIASAVRLPPGTERGAPAPTVPAPPPAPAPLDHSRLARDLRARIEPLRTTGDGTYEVHVDLHPAELGHVEVDVRVQDGVVHLRMHADHDSARHALRDALPDLRSSLEQAGVTTGDLRFDDRRAPERDPQAGTEPETVGALDGSRAVAASLPSPSDAPTTDDAVDLLL